MIILNFPFRLMTKSNSKIHNKAGRYFLSKELRDFERNVATEARRQYTGKPLEGNILVRLDAFFTNRRRPDLFNMPKSVCDALQKIVYKNDKQIIVGHLILCENSEKDYFVITVNKL